VRHWFLILFVLVLGTSVGLAQVDRATLTGTITDSTGAVIPNANVEVTSQETGWKRAVQANADGAYVVPGLPIGAYTVVVSLSGFSTASIKDVRLGVGDTRRLDVQLQVSAVETQIVVESTAAALESDTPTLPRGQPAIRKESSRCAFSL